MSDPTACAAAAAWRKGVPAQRVLQQRELGVHGEALAEAVQLRELGRSANAHVVHDALVNDTRRLQVGVAAANRRRSAELGLEATCRRGQTSSRPPLSSVFTAD